MATSTDASLPTRPPASVVGQSDRAHPDADVPWPTPHWRGASLAPLLAVCGLCGGAGTSTLSYLIARSALAVTGGHVLVCDTGGPTGGLAACAGLQSRYTLPELAEHVERGLPLVGGIYAVDEDASTPARQLRVIAAGPRVTSAPDGRALEAVLAMARSDGVHDLTVVDCGTLQRDAERRALRAASHIAWMLTASAGGARRAQSILAAIPPGPPGRELVVARRDGRASRSELRALREIAAHRGAPLVLMPQIGDVHGRVGRALDEAQVTLQAIHGVLRR